MKTFLKTVVATAWAAFGLVTFSLAYVWVAAQFEGEEFWDLGRSLGGFTIHITEHTSADILWFQFLIFAPFLLIWAFLLVLFIAQLEKRLPNHSKPTGKHG